MTKENFKQNLIGFISTYLEYCCYSSSYKMYKLTDKNIEDFLSKVNIGNLNPNELKIEINEDSYKTFNKIAEKIIDRYYKEFVE